MSAFSSASAFFSVIFAGVGGDHDLQDLVFQLARLRLRKLDLVHQRLVLLVGLDVQRLVAILADFLLLVLNVGFVLAAGGFVGLHGGLRGFDLGLGAGKLGLDCPTCLGSAAISACQRGNPGIDLLQVDEIL